MAGTAPRTKQGLIAVLVARRVMAEKKRRQALADAQAARNRETAEALEKDAVKAKRSGWFRR